MEKHACSSRRLREVMRACLEAGERLRDQVGAVRRENRVGWVSAVRVNLLMVNLEGSVGSGSRSKTELSQVATAVGAVKGWLPAPILSHPQSPSSETVVAIDSQLPVEGCKSSNVVLAADRVDEDSHVDVVHSTISSLHVPDSSESPLLEPLSFPESRVRDGNSILSQSCSGSSSELEEVE